MPTPSDHTWKFFSAGGFEQVRLDTGADLLAVAQLDRKLWVALACPVEGLEIDAATLAMVDTDGDGRIRPPELVAAIAWAGSMVNNADLLLKGTDTVSLASVRDDTPESRALKAAMTRMLVSAGKPDATSITLADTVDTQKVFAGTRLNGDGIVPPATVLDETARRAVEDVLACAGGETDRSGAQGVGKAQTEAFFAEARAFDAWVREAESEWEAVLPLGDATIIAHEALTAVRTKIDDWFARCRLAAFDGRAAAAMNRDEKEYALIAGKSLALTAPELREFPLARVTAGASLPLSGVLNPSWLDAMTTFRDRTVTPLFGTRASLTEAEWLALGQRFTVFEAWMARKQGARVEKLGIARVRELLTTDAEATIVALIAEDAALAPEADAIRSVEKLLRLHRDLGRLCRNFVNFADFYGRRDKAVFQAGTLYLDTRSCELCVRVNDAARHVAMAPLSAAYLAYCDCTRRATGETMSIVAAFTAGESDDLMVGRNGVFFDRAGRDWDATITRIVDNPISLGQAFWAPYKKVVRFVEEQVAKRASEADAAANERLQHTATAAGTAATTGTAPVAPAAQKPGFDTGVIAAMGVAAAGIGGMIGAVVGAFVGLGAWMPIGLLGIVALISGPSMLLAYLKLRRRSLGPLLDANGWAINARARINVPLGAALTETARLPVGSVRDMVDPFAEKPAPWRSRMALAGAAALFVLWGVGKFDGLLPQRVRSTALFHAPSAAPATTTPSTAAATMGQGH